MDKRLQDKVALVTGAGQGIGQAIAARLSAAGARVAIADISAEALAETEKRLLDNGGEALVLACDVSDSASVADMFRQVQARFGQLDVLVNNAGIGTAPDDGFELYQQRMAERNAQLQAGEEATVYADHITDMQDAGWQKVVDVNLNGAFYCCREAVRMMAAHSTAGSIVNIASTSAVSGEGGVHYCASKAAIIGLTRSLAMELAARGIRVNAICPGPTNTPIMANISDEWKQAMVQAIPLGRIGEPEEIANTALFLASDESSAFTGQTLMANLGTYLT